MALSNMIKAANACGVSLTSFADQVRSLRNIHTGKRAFIIGGGPSLRMEDLDVLQDEITLASNKIYLAFEKTRWRPTYYCITDPVYYCITDPAAANRAASAVRAHAQTFYLQTILPWLSPDDGVFLRERHMRRPIGERTYFSTDLGLGVYSGWTVTYALLQIAYWLGIQTVYLLGMDGYAKGEPHHFYKDGFSDDAQSMPPPYLDLRERAYHMAKRAFDADGRRILNASRSTRLTVFPRVNFDDVVQTTHA